MPAYSSGLRTSATSAELRLNRLNMMLGQPWLMFQPMLIAAMGKLSSTKAAKACQRSRRQVKKYTA